MKWSLKIGTFAGIGVYLHWSFVLLISWIFMTYLAAGKTVAEASGVLAFILALFGCVVLHEFGHALTAKRFGVKTRDITLLPIGGVARLERIPEKPLQELLVALAGPAVNVVIAAFLFGVLLVMDGINRSWDANWMRGGFLERLMWVNLFIVAFNLLPAFPMDGGRVLRSLLALRVGRARATHIAANIGQAMAIMFGFVGFFLNPFLIFIAIMVYIGAQAEASQVQMHSALQGMHVRDAMMTRFRTLSAEDSLGRAVDELLAGSQHDFPVIRGSAFAGILRREDLIKGLSEGKRAAPVADVMSSGCEALNEGDDLIPALESMSRNRCSMQPVMSDGRIVGLLTMENIGELVMVNSSLQQHQMPR